MAQADTNRGQVRYSSESTWGETPASPATKELRITSESLSHEKTTVVSDEVISDRQRAAVLEVGQSAGGDIGFELSHGDFEPFFEAALFDTIASTTVAQASTTFAASTITGAAGTDYTALIADQWVRIEANGNANDGAVVQVVSRTSTVLTITGSTLTSSVASANVTGRRLRNGTTKKSFFIEADFSDITAVKYFTGMRVDQVAVNVNTDQIVTGTFSFVGKAGATASTTVASTVVASAGTNTPMTAAANVVNLMEGGAALGTSVQSLDFTVANNLRAQRKVGQKPALGVGVGGVDVTGNLNAYFEDITLYQKFINHTESSLSFRFKDASGNVIVVTVPSLYYTAGDPQITGQDADVFVNLGWTARKDPTNDYTIQLDFLPA
jgi:hypothetical protein